MVGSLSVLGTTHWTAVVLALAYRPESYSHGSLGNFDKLPSLIHKNLLVPIMQLHFFISNFFFLECWVCNY